MIRCKKEENYHQILHDRTFDLINISHTGDVQEKCSSAAMRLGNFSCVHREMNSYVSRSDVHSLSSQKHHTIDTQKVMKPETSYLLIEDTTKNREQQTFRNVYMDQPSYVKKPVMRTPSQIIGVNSARVDKDIFTRNQ